jgi:hypothetical protein
VRAALLLPFDIGTVPEKIIHGVMLSHKFQEHRPRTYYKPLAYTVIRDQFDYSLV